jgi:hypothetical protein
LQAAALVQFTGGDGWAFLTERDPLVAGLQIALAQRVMELEEEKLETQARLIRNEIAEMLAPK